MSTFEQEAKQMLQKVKSLTAEAMNTTLVDGMHEAIKQSVQANVYARYQPKAYARRDENGIMSEAYNELTKEATADDLSIVMTNTAPGNANFPQYDGAGVPADAVEKGGPWHFPLDPDPGPRPFLEPAKEMYVGSGQAEQHIANTVNILLK